MLEMLTPTSEYYRMCTVLFMEWYTISAGSSPGHNIILELIFMHSNIMHV
jgi:hypothetical protein